MKTLKFEHKLASLIKDGSVTSTWRLNDDKNLSVGDEVRLIDKVDPERPATWTVFGMARIERVIEKRLSEVEPEDIKGYKTYTTMQEMLIFFKSYYNNDVSLSTPIKLIDFTLLPQEQGKNDENTSLYINHVKIFADGGSRGNPGPSASGYVIMDPNTNDVLVDKGEYIGVTTNNQAEYLALKYALEEAQKMGASEVDAYMDSMLVVNQLKGTFKVRNRDLWPMHEAVKSLVAQFSKFTITHVPREMNKLADAAVNRAMDGALGIERPAGAAKPKVV